MDIPNTVMAPLRPAYSRRSDERRRDTIMIRERAMTEDERKKWRGAPPTRVEKSAMAWRPSEVKF